MNINERIDSLRERLAGAKETMASIERQVAELQTEVAGLEPPGPPDFEEPWSVTDGGFLRNRNGTILFTGTVQSRMADCINALQGVRNPQAVVEWIEHVRRTAERCNPYETISAETWIRKLDSEPTP